MGGLEGPWPGEPSRCKREGRREGWGSLNCRMCCEEAHRWCGDGLLDVRVTASPVSLLWEDEATWVQRRCVYEVGARQVHKELKEVLTASHCWHAVPGSSIGTLAARGRLAIAPWSDATEREKYVLVKSRDHQVDYPKWQSRD